MAGLTLDDFQPVRRGGNVALVHPADSAVIADAMLESKGCTRTVAKGRGEVIRFSCAEGSGLIRRYLRGGIVRYILGETYLFRNPARRELAIHLDAFNAGLSVPEPLGACWARRGVAYQGFFATKELPGKNLLEYLEEGKPNARESLKKCGQLIREMHEKGIYHADLQVRNIVVVDGTPYLIDFANARRRQQLGHLPRVRNLLRLRRSFEKNGMPAQWFDELVEGYGGMRIPRWLDVLYRVKGAASDFITGRTTARTTP